MVPLLPPDTEAPGGLELGGVPIATIVSSLTGLPALFVTTTAVLTKAAVGRQRVAELQDALRTLLGEHGPAAG
ncbi:hypothetical protein [Humibacter ginsenosidimutans]|uniref:hypothetical protein n=1 Tax=Humibacter ginsenosidimutans TaxID=2599293 RepID=UPI001AEF713B|nr:hypothetical protein [Humibacter ginsenosidimutans]